MRRTLLAAYLFLGILAVALIVWIIPAYTPPYSGYGMPPAVLPYILSAILLICSLLCAFDAYRAMRAGPDETPSPLPLKRWIHLCVYAVVLFLATPLMERAGFFVGSAIVLAVLQWLAGQRNLFTLAAVSIGVAGVTWAVLWYGLQAPLP